MNDEEDETGLIAALDGRTRLLGAVLMVIAVVTLRTPEALAVALAAALTLAVFGGVPARQLAGRMLALEGFVVLLFVGLPLLSPDGPWLHLGPLAISQSGLVRAALMALRISAAGLLVLTLIGGLAPVALGHGLDRLGAPRRLTEVLFLTFRYVGLIDGEARRLSEAMRLRGFQAGTNLHTIRTYGHFIGQMLVRSFERAERIMEAMMLRGYAGRFPMIAEQSFDRRDAVFAVIAGAATVVVLGVEAWCRIS